jgi:hypothetical protein
VVDDARRILIHDQSVLSVQIYTEFSLVWLVSLFYKCFYKCSAAVFVCRRSNVIVSDQEDD